MTVWTEQLGQENQDRILGKDSQDWTGQPGQDSQGRIAREGQPEQDI
jgi:hypothetical protein